MIMPGLNTAMVGVLESTISMGQGFVAEDEETFRSIGRGGVRGQEIRENRQQRSAQERENEYETKPQPEDPSTGEEKPEEPSEYKEFRTWLTERDERIAKENRSELEEAQQREREWKEKLAKQMNAFMTKERSRRESERSRLRNSLINTYATANRRYQMNVESIVEQQRGRQMQGRGVYAGLKNEGGN